MPETEHLARAVDLARAAREHGNHPFGAVLVTAGGRILEAENTVLTSRDVTAHAETNLVRTAWAALSPDELTTSTLYASTEPCAMCSGAIFWAGIGSVVYALGSDELDDLVQGTGEFTLALHSREVFERGGHATTVRGPVDVPGAREVHAGFWA